MDRRQFAGGLSLGCIAGLSGCLSNLMGKETVIDRTFEPAESGDYNVIGLEFESGDAIELSIGGGENTVVLFNNESAQTLISAGHMLSGGTTATKQTATVPKSGDYTMVVAMHRDETTEVTIKKSSGDETGAAQNTDPEEVLIEELNRLRDEISNSDPGDEYILTALLWIRVLSTKLEVSLGESPDSEQRSQAGAMLDAAIIECLSIQAQGTTIQWLDNQMEGSLEEFSQIASEVILSYIGLSFDDLEELIADEIESELGEALEWSIDGTSFDTVMETGGIMYTSRATITGTLDVQQYSMSVSLPITVDTNVPFEYLPPDPSVSGFELLRNQVDVRTN